MYTKIVVPLDGSDLAEVALPHVQEIAGGCKVSEVVLVSVTESLGGTVTKAAAPVDLRVAEGHVPPPGGPIQGGSTFSGLLYAEDPAKMRNVPEGLGKMAGTALTYLRKTASRLEKSGLHTDVAVLIGKPAEEILHFAEEEKADLIVIASRGKSGFSRWDLGNVADKIVRASQVPVVLVKPKPGFKETKPKRHGKAA